jgi:hypothetical protein
VKTQISRRA